MKKILVLILFIISFLATSVAQDKELEIFRKSPHLIYTGKTNEMNLSWQLSKNVSCKLTWGTDSTCSSDSVITEALQDSVHSFLFTSLKTGGKIYYCVKAENNEFRGSFFSAPESSSNKLKFMVYGDTRSFPEVHNKVASKIISTYENDQSYQSLVFSVGDIIGDGSKEIYWDSQLFDPQYKKIRELLANLPYQACIGNHDLPGELFKKYFPYPYVEDYHWSFDYGPAHFVIFDQFKKYHHEFFEEIEWLEKDLSQSNKDWKFIIYHMPGWSASCQNEDVQKLIQPLCEKYNVSIVFGGHSHFYSRAEVSGVTHITTGGGGAPLYEPKVGLENVVKSAKLHHFCKIEIENNKLNFTVISSEGELIDSFNIMLK